jgi:CRISPR-associated protein Cas1
MSGHVDIRVSSGRLKLRHGFPIDGTVEEEWIGRGTCDVDHIVVVGNSGSITLDAIQWMMDLGIIVSMLDYQGNLVTDMLPTEHISPIVKQRQALASPELQRKLTLGLLQEKLGGQLETLKSLKLKGLDGSPLTVGAKRSIERSIHYLRGFQGDLSKCETPDQMMTVEAQAAMSYWGAFESIPLKWKVTAARPIPQHWLSIGSRVSPKTCRNGRFAIRPFHACLNYLYGCLESRVKRYCIAHRLDMDFPVLHGNSRMNRSSLIYDLMEPIRPSVDRLLYQFLAKTNLRVSDFFETREGICKVMPELASKIIPLVRSLDSDINRVVKEFASNFKNRRMEAPPDDYRKFVTDGNDSLDTVGAVVQN